MPCPSLTKSGAGMLRCDHMAALRSAMAPFIPLGTSVHRSFAMVEAVKRSTRSNGFCNQRNDEHHAHR
ncbi:MAG: hypothetical protein IH987_18020 [Planctomycetes bacterium]|nr:hypothetical protein [Planctomycetota bacterium]